MAALGSPLMNKFQRNTTVGGLMEWVRGKIYGFRALMVFDNWPSLLLQRLSLPLEREESFSWLITSHRIRKGCFTTDMYSRFFSRSSIQSTGGTGSWGELRRFWGGTECSGIWDSRNRCRRDYSASLRQTYFHLFRNSSTTRG